MYPPQGPSPRSDDDRTQTLGQPLASFVKLGSGYDRLVGSVKKRDKELGVQTQTEARTQTYCRSIGSGPISVDDGAQMVLRVRAWLARHTSSTARDAWNQTRSFSLRPRALPSRLGGVVTVRVYGERDRKDSAPDAHGLHRSPQRRPLPSHRMADHTSSLHPDRTGPP